MAARRKPTTKTSERKARAARANGKRGGRPRSDRGPGGWKWADVQRYARYGGARDTIIEALGIGGEHLADPVVAGRLQEEIRRGAALYQLDLLEQVHKQGKDGRVNATVASLRNSLLKWDRKDRGSDQPAPDSEAAIAELDTMLGRFRAPR